MLTKDLQSRYRFFKERAGYRVGFRAAGALELARAEVKAERYGFTFDWSDDDQLAEAFDGKEYREYPAEICVCEDRGEVLASLCGIIEASCEYRRVVEAELALEAFATHYSATWS
jgi:hypothetical protein